MSTSSSPPLRPKITLDKIIDISSFDINPSKYTCPLCEQILLTPTMCSTCKTIYCRDCIFNYVLKFNHCPNQCTHFNLTPPPPNLITSFSTFDILCTRCNNAYPITTFFQHYKRCFKSNNNSVPCWNCNTSVPAKTLKYLTYQHYAHLHKYNEARNIEDDKPFIIQLTINDRDMRRFCYVTCVDSYLMCGKHKEGASVFSEVFVDNKSYIKIYCNNIWKFLKGSYQSGVTYGSWKECCSITIDKESKTMTCNEGMGVANRNLVMRKEDEKLFFYKADECYIECCVNVIYL